MNEGIPLAIRRNSSEAEEVFSLAVYFKQNREHVRVNIFSTDRVAHPCPHRHAHTPAHHSATILSVAALLRPR